MSTVIGVAQTPSRNPVIADVAKAAGVSVPTVSRVLTGSTPVSARRRELVLKAIRDLGYRPNGAARALVSGRQAMIAVITGNTTRYGYAATIQGIEEAARKAGYLVSITVVDADDEQTVRTAVDLALGQPIAGAIVLEFDLQGTQVVNALPDGLPTTAVSSSRGGRDVPRVLFNDRKGGREATRYLLGLGHATVHHVAVPGSGRRPSGRLLGWREALRLAGAEIPDVLEADWSAQSGYQAGLLLAKDKRVTAVLCGNDEIAFGVIKALQDNGRKVPKQVSVVGFDDHPHATLWSPPLTTMAQDFVVMGQTAVSVLLGAMESHPEHLVVDTSLELVVRESATAPPVQR